MNQCPNCKNELFANDLVRCPACGQEIVPSHDSEASPTDSAETFAAEEFPNAAEPREGSQTIDDPTVPSEATIDQDAQLSDVADDSVSDEETFMEDELAEQLAEKGEQTVAFDSGELADAETEVEDESEGTVQLDSGRQSGDVEATTVEIRDEHAKAEGEAASVEDTVELEPGSKRDENVDATLIHEDALDSHDDQDSQTVDSGDLPDHTVVLEDEGDSFDETVQSGEAPGAANDAELRTLQTHWPARKGDRPEMTIKSRQESGTHDEELTPTDTITAVPLRSLKNVNDPVSLDSSEYELLSVLGEGGMGVVWSAKQTSVDRKVAVKMIKGTYSKKRGQRNKFLAEAIVTGDLDHPNIVPIYDVGTDKGGTLFYAMKQVKGTPWQKVIKDKSLHENLEILLRVADAVAFAHARGIVHRDLKPENVMLGEFGEVLVMDWGLALPLSEFDKAERIRQFSSMGGTPAYMSPEMATGPIDRITPQSDVYLLGAILWEVVTGRPPHPGRKVQQCLLAAMRNTIRETDKSGELVEIARKAMATNIADRHKSVTQFQEEVRSYLDHSESLALAGHAQEDLTVAQQSNDYNDFSKAVFGFEQALDLWPGNKIARQGVPQAKLAYAQSAHAKEDYDLALSLLSPDNESHQELRAQILADQAERDARQSRLKFAKRAMATMAASFLIVITVALLMVESARQDAEHQKSIAIVERNEADRQRGIAEVAKDEAERAKDDLQVALVEEERQRELAEKNAAEAKKQTLIAEMKQQEAEEQRKLAEKNAEEARKQEALAKEQKLIAEMKTDEAEKQRKLAEKNAETARMQTLVAQMQKAEADKQRELAVKNAQEAKRQAELARLAQQQEAAEAYIARIGLAAAKIEENAFDVAKTLLNQCAVEQRNWEWGRLMHLVSQASKSFETEGPVDAVSISPDGRFLLAGSWDNTARIWDLEQKTLLQELPHEGLYVHAVAWSPNQQLVATGGSDATGRIRLWDAQTGQLISKFSGHSDAVVSVKFSPTGEWLISCSYDETARLWDVRNPQQPVQVEVLKGHSWWVWDAAFSPDFDPSDQERQNRIVTVSQDGKAIVWRATDAPAPAAIANVVLDEDAPLETSRPWAMTQESIFMGHTGPIYAVAFSPHGSEVATGSYDKRILIWEPARVPVFDLDKVLSGEEIELEFRELTGHTSPVQAVTYSVDGGLIVSGGRDNAVKIWSTQSGKSIKTLRGHNSSVRSVDITRDGRRIISGSQDRQIMIWEIDQYEEFRVLDGRQLVGHEDAVLGAKFSSDGTKILTAGRDRTARLWDAQTGQSLRVFSEGHEFMTSNAMFLPDEKVLVTAAADNSVRLWNVETGTEILRIPNTGRSAIIAISPDGQWLVTGDSPPMDSEDDDIVNTPRANEPTGVLAWRIEKLLAAGSSDANVESADLLDTLQPLQLKAHFSRVTAAQFSPQTNHLLTCDWRGRAVLWDVETGQIVWNERHHLKTITECVFTADGKEVLTSSADQTVSRIDVTTGQEIPGKILKHRSSVTSLALSPDQSRILTVSILDSDLLNPGSILTVWDAKTSEKLQEFETAEFAINDVDFSPTGSHAIAVTTENVVRGLNLSTTQVDELFGKPLIDFDSQGRLVWAARFTDDGNSILTVGGSEAHVWEATTMREEMAFTPHGAVAAADFSPDGMWVVTGSWDNSAKIWDAQTGQALIKLQKGHTGYINSAVFSPNSRMVLTSSDDQTAVLWNAQTGKVLRTLRGHDGRVRQAIFSPDGSKILTVSNDKTARLWDAETGQPIGQPFVGHDWAVLCGAFSEDGDRIVTGSEDNTAILWDVSTQQPLGTFAGHTAAVSAVCFSEDGMRVFTASQDNTAKVWDASPQRVGAEILTLTEQSQELTSISLAPGGRQVVTGSRDGTAVVWLTSGWDSENAESEAPTE